MQVVKNKPRNYVASWRRDSIATPLYLTSSTLPHSAPFARYSQTGLASIVSIYIIFRIFASIVPRHLVKKHVLQVRDIIAMDLTLVDVVQVSGSDLRKTSSITTVSQSGDLRIRALQKQYL